MTGAQVVWPTWRYASSLGPEYWVPIYFRTERLARDHAAEVDRVAKRYGLLDLPGMDTMRVERWVDGEWQECAETDTAPGGMSHNGGQTGTRGGER